jgi:protein phosphatase
MRIAVLSDVHGNLTAFDAVLADIDARGITQVINLGDVAGKGPRGSAAVARTRERCAVTVRGNWDDFLPVSADHEDASIRWWHDELTADDRSWLVNLPLSHDLVLRDERQPDGLELGGRRVRLFHASATSVYTKVHFHHTAEEFAAMFTSTELTGGGPEPTVVLYGDVHDAYVETDRGRTLVNVGSVGNPLDETTAAYVILEAVRETFSIQIVRVPYDIEAELAVAEAAQMPAFDAWATELRAGVYRGQNTGLGSNS